MSLNSKQIPLSKRFFPGLLPIIGDDKYEQVTARYRDLYSSHVLTKNPCLQWHLTEGILPGLALYQILRESGESQESALGIIDQTFRQLFSDNLKKMRGIGRMPQPPDSDIGVSFLLSFRGLDIGAKFTLIRQDPDGE